MSVSQISGAACCEFSLDTHPTDDGPGIAFIPFDHDNPVHALALRAKWAPDGYVWLPATKSTVAGWVREGIPQ